MLKSNKLELSNLELELVNKEAELGDLVIRHSLVSKELILFQKEAIIK